MKAEKVVGRIEIRKIAAFVLMFLIAGAVVSIPILISGFNPLKVYSVLLSGGFGSIAALGYTFTKTASLLFCSLGVLIAFRCGIWNIGAEGQLYMGGLGAVIVGLFLKGIPAPLHIFLVFIASFIGGALWAAIAGFLKVRYRTNEMIVTLLMNFIAFWIVFYMVRFPLRTAAVFNPVTPPIAETARLPIILPGTSLHMGILIALLFSFVIWFGFRKTILGYRIRAVGSNPEATLYGGIAITKVMMVSMLVSGGMAGLAGMSEVAGVQYLLSENISFNYGYLAIPTALLGRLNPLGAIAASLFIGGLLTGGRYVQFTLGIPYTLIYMVLAIFILAVLLESSLENLLSSLI
jgi:ABC-type uncharacterized transport system permease subunit